MRQTNPMGKVPDSDIPCEVWRPLACHFSLESSSALLDHLRAEAEAGMLSPHGEREIGGVLFGINEPDCIRIVASRPLKCEHAMGPGFVLSERDEQRMAQLIASPAADPGLSGLVALGWYHSHIHSRIFLSERDLKIHSQHFPEPFQVALVLRPWPEKPVRAGYFFRERAGEIHTESSYQEFTVRNLTLEPPLRRPAFSVAPSRPQTAPFLRKLSPPAETVCPKCGGKHLRRTHREWIERLWGLAGFYPYRCEECLSRSLHQRSAGLLELAHPHSRKRPEERKRAWVRTRREILLYGGSILGFILFLFYLVRDTGPKPDQP